MLIYGLQEANRALHTNQAAEQNRLFKPSNRLFKPSNRLFKSSNRLFKPSKPWYACFDYRRGPQPAPALGRPIICKLRAH